MLLIFQKVPLEKEVFYVVCLRNCPASAYGGAFMPSPYSSRQWSQGPQNALHDSTLLAGSGSSGRGWVFRYRPRWTGRRADPSLDSLLPRILASRQDPPRQGSQHVNDGAKRVCAFACSEEQLSRNRAAAGVLW